MAQTPSWLEELLSDSQVTDICINGAESIYVDRGLGTELLSTPAWELQDVRSWVLDQLSKGGKTWDAKYPFVDSPLPSGHRMHCVFPPVASASLAISLRRTALCANPAPSIEETWKNQAGYDLLRSVIQRKENLVIAGATGSGKTTLLNTLLSDVAGKERVLLLEDTPELLPRHPHSVRLLSRPANSDGYGEVTLRTLIREALRMRPDRLIIGECRGPEVLDILQAMNTGHRGTLATVHASSARDALRRLELLALLGSTLPSPVVRELIAGGIQWVVHLERTEQGRKIMEIVQLAGREGDTILLRPVLRSSP